MRALRRNLRTIWFAHRKSDVPSTDESGYLTLDYVPEFTEPESIRCLLTGESGGWNGAETGEYRPDPMGLRGDFTRTAYISIHLGLPCPIREGDVIWVDRTTDQPNDYEVVRVTGMLGEWNVGMREVGTQ